MYTQTAIEQLCTASGTFLSQAGMVSAPMDLNVMTPSPPRSSHLYPSPQERRHACLDRQLRQRSTPHDMGGR